MEDLVDHIVATVTDKFESEVPGEFIGTMVMDGLRELDEVAYVRFASVYRRFQEATDFVQEVKKLEAATMIALRNPTACCFNSPTARASPARRT